MKYLLAILCFSWIAHANETVNLKAALDVCTWTEHPYCEIPTALPISIELTDEVYPQTGAHLFTMTTYDQTFEAEVWVARKQDTGKYEVVVQMFRGELNNREMTLEVAFLVDSMDKINPGSYTNSTFTVGDRRFYPILSLAPAD